MMGLKIGHLDYFEGPFDTYANVDVVAIGTYADGSVVFELQLPAEGDILATPTVYLGPDYGLYAKSGWTFVKNYSEGEGMVDALVKAGIVEAGDTVTFGPFDTTATEVRLTESYSDALTKALMDLPDLTNLL